MQVNDIISSGLLELYATDIASPEEVQQVEQWVAQYPEVAAELEKIQESMESYALAHAIQPSENVKEKIFKKLSGSVEDKTVHGSVAKVVGIAARWKWLAAASFLLLIGSGIMNALLLNRNSIANKELEESQLFADNLKQENETIKKDMQVVQDKYSMPVALKPMPGKDASAKIFWMTNTGDVYIDPSNLPDAPSGKQYQLWAIVDGKPVDAGMIATTKKGDKFRIQKMKTFGVAQAFAITLEKEGGNPTPTMDEMVVMGKM
ncbi:MAG: anti-sigma factor [Bacteroidota bacterium]